MSLSPVACTQAAPLPFRLSEAQAAVALATGSGLKPRSDDQLAQLARDGRSEAFDELVLRHQAAALQLAGKYLGDAALAKDVCQAAFLEVFRGLASYQAHDRFVFWFRRILINQCRMAARSSHRRNSAAEALAGEPTGPIAWPDELLQLQERRRAVEAALQDLSEKLKEVALLRYVAGHTLEEVANILELPLGTVKSRLFSAVAGLRAALAVRRG